jgi:hypothetical protein
MSRIFLFQALLMLLLFVCATGQIVAADDEDHQFDDNSDE